MRRIALILKTDIKRRLKTPYSVLVLLLIPFVMTAIMGAVFAPSDSGSQIPKIKVLLVDNDKSAASKLLVSAFDSKEMTEMFQVTVVDEEKGRQQIAKGKASALLIIPDGFTAKLTSAEKTVLTVIKNPSEQFLPQVVEEFINTFGIIISGVVQVFEEEIKIVKSALEMKTRDIDMITMLPILEKGKQKIVSLEKYLDPLVLELKKEVTGKKKKKNTFNIFSAVLPGISIMFMMFIIEIFLREILTDREDGKLQRMMFAPLPSSQYVLARIISGWVMGILVFFIVGVFGSIFFSISWGNYLVLFVFIALTSLWIASFFALLNSLFKNKNQAGAITSPVILAFAAFGGSMIPVNQLPDAFRSISQFTLNHWFIEGVRQITSGKLPVQPFLVLAVTCVLLLSAAIVFLKKRITI
ncbi:MAG: ABC transporter permease [bacterium]|nr:ABC transporter permease [bacterium]